MAGRPEIPIDWELLDKIAIYYLPQEDVAAILGISLDCLLKRVKKKYGEDLATFLDKRRSKTRLMIHQKQMEMAMRGNVTMLIWLGKNLLGQKDSPIAIDPTAALETIEYVTKWGSQVESATNSKEDKDS